MIIQNKHSPWYIQTSVQTGIENSFVFDIYTIYTDLEYFDIDFGDDTKQRVNISG